MIWRSGRLTQPRLGVSRTMPRLVSSGPGAPTPTPRISAPGTSRRVAAMARSARPTSRSSTSLGAGLRVGRLARGGERGASRPRPRCRRRGWSRRCQCPVRIARCASTPDDGRHRRRDRLDRQLPHAAVMTQRADLRPVRRAGTAGRATGARTTRSRGPRGPKPNAGTVGPKTATTGVPDRGRQVQRRRVVGDQHRRPLDQRRRGAEAQRARRAVRPTRRGGRDGLGQRRVLRLRPPPRSARPATPRARRSRASAWCPRSSRAPAPTKPGATPALAEPGVGRGAVVRGEARSGPAARPPAAAGQRQQPLDLVAAARPRDAAGVGRRRRAVREADPLAGAREQRERGRPPRAVRQVRPSVAPGPEPPAQPPDTAQARGRRPACRTGSRSPTAGCVSSSAAAAGVVTTSTGPCRAASAASSGVVSTTSPRKAVWMTSDGPDGRRAIRPLIPPAAPPGTPPAGSRRRRSASCASSPPSASRGACASG